MTSHTKFEEDFAFMKHEADRQVAQFEAQGICPCCAANSTDASQCAPACGRDPQQRGDDRDVPRHCREDQHDRRRDARRRHDALAVMTDKLAPLLPRIAQLMLVALDRASADGERVNAMRAIDHCLQGAGADKFELVERVKQAPVTEADMQKVFDAGYAKRRTDEAELRCRGVARRGNIIRDGVNGYSWTEVASYCALNKQRIHNRWEANFVESVAEQLAFSRYATPSEKQAPILRNIFLNWFNGTIT